MGNQLTPFLFPLEPLCPHLRAPGVACLLLFTMGATVPTFQAYKGSTNPTNVFPVPTMKVSAGWLLPWGQAQGKAW